MFQFCHKLLERFGLDVDSFDPTLVRFCPPARFRVVAAGRVSIPPWFDFAASSCAVLAPVRAGFNPTLVRFCLQPDDVFEINQARFNPTLVRFCLRYRYPFWRDLIVSIPPWFDFAAQCGRLPTFPTLSVSIQPWFDFAADRQRRSRNPHRGFNPTLVRFCPDCTLKKFASRDSFNPTLVRFCPCHDGSATSLTLCFNPTLVRFCRRSDSADRQRTIERFNPTLVRFCLKFSAGVERIEQGFNPTLVQFCRGRIHAR